MDDDPFGSMLLRWLVLILAIGAGTVLSCAKTALLSVNETKLRGLARSGRRRAQKAAALGQEQREFWAACMNAGRFLVNLFAIAFACAAFYRRLGAFLSDLVYRFAAQPAGAVSRWFYAAAVVLIVLGFGSLIYVLVYLLPKKAAMQHAERMLVSLYGLTAAAVSLMKPYTLLFDRLADLLAKLFGLDPQADERRVTEEEIRMLVDAGEERGVLEDSQREMINNIFEFDDIDAGDIMTHRTDIEAVEAEQSVQEAAALAIRAGVSRIPVYQEDLDHIIGVIYVKDLLKFVGEKIEKKESLKSLLRPAFYVPETMQCGKLFAQMTEQHIQMAIVVDEYGGTAGLVTMEDLLESIVGNIQDEYDQEEGVFD
ncbi:MAG: hemolysin family protein, partial [Clostridiales bacterium]|nr:hemolysin family protein [Clostridiales bacterium]